MLKSVFECEPSDGIALLIAPVKGQARICAKVEEYAEEYGYDVTKWPFVQCVGDLLRASVVCENFDLVAEAWGRIESAFDVREGHGRIKSNWLTTELRPPDMLINVMVEKPGMPPLAGEIQIHLREIILAKEATHRLYEISRAASIEKLLEEASKSVDAHAAASANHAGDGETDPSCLERVAQRVTRAFALTNRQDMGASASVVVSPLRADEMGCEMVQSSSVAVDPDPEAPPLEAGHEQRASELADEHTMAQQQGGEPESKGDEAGMPESKGDGDS